MKNMIARGGIEFLAVLLGITGSLFIEDKYLTLSIPEKDLEMNSPSP